MKLLIVESPAKAKTISKYLNGEYTVVASVGHIRDLPKSNKQAIDIEGGFIPHYEISKGKEKVVSEIKSLSKKASEILLATDPDREGEAIAWHIAELIEDKSGKSKAESQNSKVKRVSYVEITEEAIREALGHPREIDQNLRQAQEARRVLDRLVGYDLSGLIWKKVRYGLSAGRVQSPALRIIMEREREIRAFKSHTFWVISADVSTAKKNNMTLVCEVEPTDEKTLKHIVDVAEKGGEERKWFVKDIKESDVKKSPRAPFITSTLQQTASSRLGFSPSRTMGIAQKLYEAGHITYMRTDSTNLSGVAIAQIAEVVEKKFGKEYLQIRKFATKSKNAQEAHEAVRPSHFNVEHAGINDEQKKLYELIWRRAVSSQMKDALTLRTKITANVKDADIPDFSITGSQIKFPGWLLGDPASRGDDVELPKVSVDEKLELKKVSTEEKQTEPPGRYSEAGLIKELEKRGIGRPSTYASTIKTLEDRGYVDKVNKALVPTDTGDVVSSFLEANFADYISDSFTAEMEDKLDLIADGKEEYVKTLKTFYGPFLAEVKSKDKMDKVTNMGDADPSLKCPTCDGPMIIKLSRGGKFLSCAKYPECEGSLTMDGLEIKKEEPIGTDPESGLPIYIMIGKYGPYVQLGDRVKGKGSKKAPKPKMTSIPKGKDLSSVTLEDALTYLTLPRVLGVHPETGEKITANVGMFGPYVVHQKDFRSLKEDDVYTIELPRALEIFAQEKKKRGFRKKKAE
ncbi:MAG: DNA topoisomerase I [Candidatus Zambryskibacteria bacterium RIFOXYD1_FULL_40_13]|nr:MAG: topoisomerase protein [Parcubacteria group bacterium GW2011_GWC1_39_12]KKR19568.1 MAG: topoisomerase protein [Parcubacteria group bacterium GW2011_GWF1_39_37]KKR35722.1 MAG: topoisomerase protein [Parcubacteria group bacterium GW2011_GWC2_40_10]KKR52536.1 MAG: topoisomerase protein [Parcubacteria group bacterium GW2011_GWE1_40_20]KKR68984.1 MAG: topoisomerase protein [Parcubacteria group bacterium GW2011_GWF2_40_69]KKR81740.1 MAG: topoisomerase protein [Parcubacteria group bacterium GW